MLQCLSYTLREIHRLSREVPTANFQDAAFEAMKGLVRFDTGFWGGGVVVPPVLHYARCYQLPTEEMTSAFEKVKCNPEHVALYVRCSSNSGKAQVFDTQEAGIGHFYRSFDVDQIVTVYQYDADLGYYHVVSLYRNGEERFTEQESLLFESAVPHLLDAWRESNLLHLSGVNKDLCPLTPAAALLDKEGLVHFARQAFVQLLRHEWPDWYGPYVPETMRQMRGGIFVGEKVVVRFTPQEGLYLAVMRKKGPLDQLSCREREVARQLAQGASYKEIALALEVAPGTVRNHIARIHAKLGVSKVTQVAALFLGDDWL